MKKNIELLFFSFLVLLFVLLFLFSVPNTRYILAIVLFIIPIIYFLKAVLRFITKKFTKGILNICVCVCVIIILLKYSFAFYHSFFSFSIIITIGIYLLYIYKRKLKRDLFSSHIVSSFIFVISLIALLISNESYLRLIQDVKYDYIPYKKLKWEDFRGTPFSDSTYEATIMSNIDYRINKFNEYVIILQMSRIDSWKKNHITESNVSLLKHEQGHLDLRKIILNRIKDSIHTIEELNKSNFNKIVKYWLKESVKQDSLYDLETNHSLNNQQQLLWNDFINKELAKFN